MPQKTQIEALLAGAGKTLPYKEIARLTNASLEDAREAARALQKEYEENQRGIRIALTENNAELVTAPEYGRIVQKCIQEEDAEMTQAQIETLAILAYRGPLTRAELEDIRGVNCAVILRNLRIAELIEENSGTPSNVYGVSTAFLKGIGLERRNQLPEYEILKNGSTQ